MSGRRFLVFAHVITSVGWMGQALAMLALLVEGRAYGAAHVVDQNVLLYLANASAFTGLMLCGLTPWGYFRYWWVLVKFTITISQLYLGIFFLSPRLDAAVGAGHASPWLPLGTGLMVSAIAFQAWVSIAKPWSRTPWAPARKPAAAPAWTCGVAVAVPAADYLLGTLLFGFPSPLLQLLVVIGYPIRRATRGNP
jgi:hypothetical protein